MNIQKHTVVALTYELKLNDATGEFIEKTTEEEPLVFLAGIGMMLPKFEVITAASLIHRLSES